MNLEGKISERLWIEIKSNYESRNFAGQFWIQLIV
jgi:hypothetical protein